MCLEIKKGTSLKVAERDIECYKTVVFRNGCLVSLWRDFVYSRDEKFPIQEKFEEPWFNPSNVDYAYRGFHTFRCMDRAKHDLEFTGEIRFLYMRCVIPKGARYYIGTDRDYCSDSLIVTGWKTRTMKRWVSWSPCLHPEFIDPAVASKVERKCLKKLKQERRKVMCLDTHWRKAKTADRDIVCYKIVTRGRGMRRGTYRSFWRNYKYSLGGYYHEPCFMPDLEGRENRTYIEGKPTFFCDYGFHSYSKGAGHLLGQGDVLIKCVIPKGVRYYESIRGSEYCAEEIKVVAQAKTTPIFEEDKVKWITEFN